MPTIVVAYPSTPGARFDKDYYAKEHTDLVKQTWEPHGLSDAEILFPAEGEQPYAAMILLRFPDQAAIDAVLGDPATGAVLADVPNFTDIAPVMYRTA